MSGSRAGGLKTRDKNLAKDPDYYRKMGRLGGSAKGRPGGFGSHAVGNDGLTGFERARIVGAKGGRISKRTKKVQENA